MDTQAIFSFNLRPHFKRCLEICGNYGTKCVTAIFLHESPKFKHFKTFFQIKVLLKILGFQKRIASIRLQKILHTGDKVSLDRCG